MRTALYRHFDADGSLLYVGVSLHSMRRLAQHMSGSEWHHQIAAVQIQWLPTRAAAFAAEAIAIAREMPVWNTARPPIPNGKGAPPIPSLDAPDVRVIGDDLHPIIWSGVQWAVTEYGIEARDGRYLIEAHRLRESEPDHSWAKHLDEKDWVDIKDFRLAFAVACTVHRGETFRDPRRVVAH